MTVKHFKKRATVLSGALIFSSLVTLAAAHGEQGFLEVVTLPSVVSNQTSLIPNPTTNLTSNSASQEVQPLAQTEPTNLPSDISNAIANLNPQDPPNISATTEQTGNDQNLNQNGNTSLITKLASQSVVANLSPYSILKLNLDKLNANNASDLSILGKISTLVQTSRTAEGAKNIAKYIAKSEYSWGSSQFGCLVHLWDGESHWNYLARNRYSGALGIAQANPATKMATVAIDYQSNPITQIRWGLSYIKARYGSPCQALKLHRWRGYY